MKAKDLKSNYTFATRKPYIEDGVFYVPHYFSDYGSFVMPSFANLFGNINPVFIEYCSGNGDWVAEQAAAHPEENWIAVEKRFDRVRKIWARAKNRRLSNLLIVCGEAYTFSHHYLKDQTISGIFIHFPDPWPKTKHAKNRLMQERFLKEKARILQSGKEVVIVSDDLVYINQTIALFKNDMQFDLGFEAPHYCVEPHNYGCSWFENLWREKGKDIYKTRFIRNAATL